MVTHEQAPTATRPSIERVADAGLAQGRVSRCPFAAKAPAAPDDGLDTKVTSPADLWRDQPVIDAIDRWSAIGAPDGLVLAQLISDHVRAVGKHFLSVPILVRLAEIRRQHGAGDAFLDAFLHSVLDKFEGRYYNRTYLALPLLEEICDDVLSDLDPEQMSALLLADVVRFETASAADDSIADRPDPATSRKRITHALRFLASFHDADSNDVGRDLDLAQVLETLPALPATQAGDWFDKTIAPVYVAHDEYFFMRALQAHEMVFTTLATDLRAATTSLRDGRFDDAVASIEHANKVYPRAAMLFRLVATMRPDHFHAFREFTQGASAIQSEQYKRFEIACGAPSAERLKSDAFTNVPAVQADAIAGHDSLSQAYLDARRDNMFTADQWDVLDAALNKLEGGHQRWKATHHSLAARMLGEAHGSGYTAGVPYLRKCLENRLFWRLADYLEGSRAG
ncbi:tryptophan 2,3-dioxygenase family protein [Mycobacterium sp. NPDC051804]|uniref:tryptophan 2,3-dioxygenase family protein n=1 Tax=Mycobacterium sp. NPDC051804 TaxID=3364295 RepID=UPI003792056D